MKELVGIFIAFFKTGLFTIGGGYAMLPILENELVNKTQMIEKADILECYVLGQALPGVIAVNTSAFIGYRLKKIKGVVAAVIGVILPSIIIIIIVALMLDRLKDNVYVDKLFLGMRAAVMATITLTLYNMIRRNIKKGHQWVIAILCFFLIGIVGVTPPYLLLIALAGAWIYYKAKRDNHNGINKSTH